MQRLLFLIILQIIFFTNLQAQEPTIDLTDSHRNVGENLLYYEDQTATMTFYEIKQLSNGDFLPLNKPVDSHVFTSSSYWYKTTLVNPTQESLSRIISFEIPWLDTINVFIINNNNELTTYEGGNKLPFSHRSEAHPFPNFEHTFKTGTSVLFVQVKTRDPFVVPISILKNRDFLLNEVSHFGVKSFIYGVLFAMLIYNLLLYFSVRVKSYLFFVFYLIAFILMNLSYNGHTFEYLFFNYPEIQNWMQSTTIYFFSIAGLLFAYSFLNLKRNHLVLHYITLGVITAFIATMFIAAFFGYSTHVIFSISMVVIYTVFVVFLGFYSLVNGNKSARFFLLGTLAGLIGSMITALTVMAIIPFSEIGFKAVEYGIVIDSILFSLAIADRIKFSNEERLKAQIEAKTDVLTGVLNRRAYDEVCEKELNRFKRYNESLSLVFLDIDHFKNINDTYGHSVGDLALKEFAKLISKKLRQDDYFFRLGGEEFALLLPHTNIEEAEQFAQRIRMEVENLKITFGDEIITMTLSLGVTQFTQSETIAEIEQKADQALYLAKNGGRNNVVPLS